MSRNFPLAMTLTLIGAVIAAVTSNTRAARMGEPLAGLASLVAMGFVALGLFVSWDV